MNEHETEPEPTPEELPPPLELDPVPEPTRTVDPDQVPLEPPIGICTPELCPEDDGELIPPITVYPDELAATGVLDMLVPVLVLAVGLLLLGLAFWAARSWAGAIEYRCSRCSWRVRTSSPGRLRALAEWHERNGCSRTATGRADS